MPFFDFHCHPGLKPQFANPATKPSPWDFINAKLTIFKDVTLGINPLFNGVLNSQSNLTQLWDNDVKLIGLILHAPEQKIGSVLSKKKIVNKGLVNLIDKTQLAYITTGVHSFDLIKEELHWLKNAPTPAGKKLKILSNLSDYDDDVTDTVFGAIIIEGLHCFFDDPEDKNAKIIFTKNFDDFTNAHTIIAINLCHMQQNLFCNHAYGIQLFNPSLFYPTNYSITTWGKEVIQTMTNKKILVDIKHMSFKARWELYTLFEDENDNTKYTQPIICTHAGTTGISLMEKTNYFLNKPIDRGLVYEIAHLKPKSKYHKDCYHNCSSINLYDEDIANIFLSGGIVGLSFDKRILGFADENVLPDVWVPHDVEYISKMEANFFFGPNDPTQIPVLKDDSKVWEETEFALLDPSLYISTHRRFLINNIVHLLWVANKHPNIELNKAATQICMGTDFDGLINAIDCCKNADGLHQLKIDMRDELSNMLTEAGIKNINVDTFLNNFFFNNGKNFILQRLKIMTN